MRKELEEKYKNDYCLTLAIMAELAHDAKKDGKDVIELPERWYKEYPNLLSLPSKDKFREIIDELKALVDSLAAYTGKPLTYLGCRVVEKQPTYRPHDLAYYTGLRDKDGNPIFEGSILGDGITTAIVEQTLDENFPIIGFCLRDITKDKKVGGFSVIEWSWVTKQAQIIGNRWENEELLPK